MGYQNDIRPFLVLSNVLVHPSYREGFPNVVLQGASMELPCIVTDICGSNEIINNKVTGLVVPPKNSKSLYSAMRELYQNDELYDDLKSKSRESIMNYNQSKIWNLILSEYNSYSN